MSFPTFCEECKAKSSHLSSNQQETIELSQSFSHDFFEHIKVQSVMNTIMVLMIEELGKG